MKKELEKQLTDKYPALFRGKDMPITENLMSFGCDCGDGWFELIKQACHLITNHSDPNFVFTQIKEKYGTLRIYYAGNADYVEGVVDMAEAMSAHTCEVCGAPGKVGGTGWLSTRCEKHDA